MFTVSKAFAVKRHVSIDLHGLKIKAAKAAVISKIKYLAEMNIEEVTIVTGRGAAEGHVNADGQRGVIFKAFPSWIKSSEVRNLVKSCVKNMGNYTLHLNVELTVTKEDQSIHDFIESPIGKLLMASQKESLKKEAQAGNFEAQAFLGIQTLFFASEVDNEEVTEGISLLKSCAQNGNQIAQLFIAQAHCTGLFQKKGIRKDHKKSVTMFHKVISGPDKTHAREAHFLLGSAYILGAGAEQDDAKGVYHLTIAANEGHKLAQFSLADLYEYGLEIDKDLDKSAELYIKAAEQGLVDAQIRLAEKYASGYGLEVDLKKSLHWRLKAALAGHDESQFIVGEFYEDGSVVKKNHNIAYNWSRKAAMQNHSEAKLRVAYSALFGLACAANDRDLGWQWLQEAVSEKNADAIYMLSNLCKDGNAYVEKNIERSIQLLKESAELGCIGARKVIIKYEIPGIDIESRILLSWVFEAAHDGIAEFQFLLAEEFEKRSDYNNAVNFYTLAADQDYIPAQYKLYTLYLEGQFVQKNERQAVKWIQRAADLGYPEAENIIGTCFSNGLHGFEENDILAYPWFLKAAEKNHTQAQMNLVELIMQSPGAFADKKARATVWIKKAVDSGDSGARFFFNNLDSVLTMHHEVGEAKRAEKLESTVPDAVDAERTFVGLRRGFLLR